MPVDQPQGLVRVPPVHQDGRAAARHHREHGGERRDVEERERHQDGLRPYVGEFAARAEHRRRREEARRHRRRAPGGVGRGNGLGVSGGSRGVEQRGVGPRVDRPGREAHAGGRGRQVLEALGARARPDADGQQPGPLARRPAGEPRLDPGGPLAVGDHHGRLAVVQRVRQLLRLPPGVQRHGDQAGGLRGPEGDLPLGEVAHRDHHPVAGAQPVRAQQVVGEGGGPRVVAGEGEDAAGGDQERAVAVRAGGVQQVAQRGRAGAVAGAVGGGGDGEGHTGRAQGGLHPGDQGERFACHDVLGCCVAGGFGGWPAAGSATWAGPLPCRRYRPSDLAMMLRMTSLVPP